MGATLCAVETAAVMTVLGADAPLTPCAHPSPLVAGLKEHHGALVPIVDLRRWPGLVAEGATAPRGRWVLVRAGDAPLGIAADEVTGVFDVAPADARPVSIAPEGSVVRAGHALGDATALELDLAVLSAAVARGGRADGSR